MFAKTWCLLSLVTIAVVLSGCGGAVDEESISDIGDGGAVAAPTPTPVSSSPSPSPSPTIEPTPDAEPSPIPSISPSPAPIVGDVQRGAELYASGVQACAVCHGDDGNAPITFYPDIDPNQSTFSHSSEPDVELDLVTYLHRWMPLADPMLCDEQCSADIAAYILSWADQTPPMTSPEPSPSPSPEPSPQPVACDDMQTLMQQPELNCTNSSCHAASPSQAAKISLVGSVDDLAARLGNADSVNSACVGEKIIDVSNPSNSLLLKLIDPDSGDQCASKMPVGSTGVSSEHFQCFEQWVNDIAASPEVPAEEPAAPFEAVPVLSALNKTKHMLQGGAVSEEEFNDLSPTGDSVDLEQLKLAIETWMTTDEFKSKFMSFLQLSLQQKNIGPDLLYRAQFDNINNSAIDKDKIIENFESSFVRTAYQIVEADADFRTVATTREWQVTTTLLLALSYADYERRLPFKDDSGNNDFRSFEYLCGDAENEAGCSGVDDYADWRTVRLTQGSSSANFEFTQEIVEDLRDVGEGDSFALLAPRVGFFTTPVFFQSYESNVGNSFRVTANQAMIIGLGLSFEAGDTTPSGDLTSLDSEHAGEDNPECYSCHRMLDPMRQVFDNHFVVDKSRALTDSKSIPAAFAFHGGEAELNTVYDLGDAIFNHPNFGKAWVGKLCNWATSAPCDQTSEEFLRLVEVFESSGYRMKALVVEMFASPLVTGLEYVEAFASTPHASVVLNRTNHFCSSMESRLNQARRARGLEDSPLASICTYRSNARNKAALLPQDEFSRGQIDLIQSVTLDPFLVTGYQQLCESVQNDVIRFGAGTEGDNYNYIFNASQSAQSIDEMVRYVMGIPVSSELYDEVYTAFQKTFDIYRHSDSCEDQGLDPVDANTDEVVCGFGENSAVALRAVWVAACSSPTSIGMGF